MKSYSEMSLAELEARLNSGKLQVRQKYRIQEAIRSRKGEARKGREPEYAYSTGKWV